MFSKNILFFRKLYNYRYFLIFMNLFFRNDDKASFMLFIRNYFKMSFMKIPSQCCIHLARPDVCC